MYVFVFLAAKHLIFMNAMRVTELLHPSVKPNEKRKIQVVYFYL